MKRDDGSAVNSSELEQKMVVINGSGKVRLISSYVFSDYHLLSLPYSSNYFVQGQLMSSNFNNTLFRVIRLTVWRHFRLVQFVCIQLTRAT